MNLGRRPKRPQSPTLDQALREFLLDGKARQFTKATLDHYRGRIGAFVRWASEQTSPFTTIDDVTSTTLRVYLVHLQDRGLASNTQHTHARALRAFFNFCRREGWIETSPFDTVKMPRPDKVEKPAFDDSDVRRLLRACDSTRDTAIVLMLLDTGLRASEFCALNIGDVDLDRMTVAVRQGKGRKDRTAYIGAKTVRQLSRYLMERGSVSAEMPLIASESLRNLEGRLTRSGLRRILRRIGDAASVAHCHPHTFRRTFAIWALRNGMNIYALAGLMGHAGIDVLRRYLAIVDTDLKRAHDDAGPVDNLLR